MGSALEGMKTTLQCPTYNVAHRMTAGWLRPGVGRRPGTGLHGGTRDLPRRCRGLTTSTTAPENHRRHLSEIDFCVGFVEVGLKKPPTRMSLGNSPRSSASAQHILVAEQSTLTVVYIAFVQPSFARPSGQII